MNFEQQKVDDRIEIEFNEFVGYGCSATLNGELYYVGGGNTNKQVNIRMIDKIFTLTQYHIMHIICINIFNSVE